MTTGHDCVIDISFIETDIACSNTIHWSWRSGSTWWIHRKLTNRTLWWHFLPFCFLWWALMDRSIARVTSVKLLPLTTIIRRIASKVHIYYLANRQLLSTNWSKSPWNLQLLISNSWPRLSSVKLQLHNNFLYLCYRMSIFSHWFHFFFILGTFLTSLILNLILDMIFLNIYDISCLCILFAIYNEFVAVVEQKTVKHEQNRHGSK